MLTDIFVLGIGEFVIGVCLGVTIAMKHKSKAERRLTQALDELSSAKKELALCEAEIEHLKQKRDSRGRFRKG